MALSQEGVRSQRLAGQVEFKHINQRDESADFIGLLGVVIAAAP